MLDFYEELKLARNERREKEYQKRNSLDYKAETIYNRFCVWAKQNGITPTEKNFNLFLKEAEESEEVRVFIDKQWFDEFGVKKMIFEKWFGYTFKIDGAKWTAKKKQ